MPRSLKLAIASLLVAVAGLGFMVARLRTTARHSPKVEEARPLAPPVAGQARRAVLYVASDDDGALHRRDVSVVAPAENAKRARQILRALISEYQQPGSQHTLGAGADINDVYLVGDNLAVVDANAAFAGGHRSGILIEELTLASLAETLHSNLPGITRLKLLIDGRERATLAGHADLGEPYETSSGLRLIKDTGK